jgi:hypothetical protein
MTTRTATRIVGDREPFTLAEVPVTPKCQMRSTRIIAAHSPLDALVRYCDRHAWHTGATTPERNGAMRAEIYASDDVPETLTIAVRPIACGAPLSHRGMRTYDIVIE